MKALSVVRTFFHDLLASYIDTIRRYPISILGSLVLFFGMIGAYEGWNSLAFLESGDHFWTATMLAGVSFITIGVLEGLSMRIYRQWWILLVALFAWIILVWIFIITPWGYAEAGWLKIPPLLLLFLFAALLPSYWYEDGREWFIRFNRSILYRAIVGYLFASVFYGGLALGLAAIITLFQLDISSDWYAYMFFATTTIVFPGYLLSGLPWDDSATNEALLNKITHYISRFLLIPFTAAYLLILYAYFIRQLVLQEWPDGWIGPLSIGLSVLAIFTKYISAQLIEVNWNAFEKWIRKIIFPALIIVGVAIVLAIFKRVGEYGWTESRWAGMLSGLLITVAALYYTLRARADLRYAIWLAILFIVFNWVGPFSGTQVALHSQIERIRSWEQDLALNEKAEKPWEDLSDEQKTRTKEILEFFKEREYWAEMEDASQVWNRYRAHRGPDEKPEDSWRSMVKAFPRKIFRSKEVMDWATHEKVWLDNSYDIPEGQFMTMTSMVRSRNEFGPWTFNWGARPEAIFTDDRQRKEISLKPKMDSLISLHPMYYRYDVENLPCIQIRQDSSVIKLCFTELEVRFAGGDTLYYPEEVMIWTNNIARIRE